MWLVTPTGFFSVISAGPEQVCVRARVRDDLHALRREFLPELSKVNDRVGTDYPFRAWAPRDAFARAVARMALELDYTNVKNEVERRQGRARHDVYLRVWSALSVLGIKPLSAAR